jgi:hypothetical protein
MSNEDIRKRLSVVAAVFTLDRHVRNDIRGVGEAGVIVQSERTGQDRVVSYDQLRRAEHETKNGSVVRTLARVVGLY